MTRKRFHAVCRLPVPVRVQDLTEEQEKIRSSSAVKHKGEWCALVPHDHEFDDPYLFDEHMKSVHGRSIARKVWSDSDAPLLPMPVKMWKPARLPQDGKPFEPTGLQPGATVTWRELVPTGETVREVRYDHEQKRDVYWDRPLRDWVERSGQVWSSLGAKSAWVVPFEPFEGELAVCVHEEKYAGLRHERTWTRVGYKDAAA